MPTDHFVFTVEPLYNGLLNTGELSIPSTACCPLYMHRATYKTTTELGTPLYKAQKAGSQWAQVPIFHTINHEN